MTSICTCHRIGMSCIPLCGNCHCLDCTNSVAQQIVEDIEHFFKIFLKFFVKGYYEQFDLYALDMFLNFYCYLSVNINDYSVYLDNIITFKGCFLIRYY